MRPLKLAARPTIKRETNIAGPAIRAATPETTKIPAPITAPIPTAIASPRQALYRDHLIAFLSSHNHPPIQFM